MIVFVLALVACPLPFEFRPSETTGSALASNDPANPSVTAAPTLVIEEVTSGSSVNSEPDDITAAKDLRISFASETPGASFFYTVNGNDPVPGSAGTRTLSADGPIVFSGHGEGGTVKVVAIAPSRYPSIITTRLVTVSYEQLAAPTFSPEPGNFATDQSITIAGPAGAAVYYTVVDGTGGAPTPQPGEPGTILYDGTPITVSGTGSAKSIAAVAMRPEMRTSEVAVGMFTIGYAATATPTFSPTPGTYNANIGVTITTTTADAEIWYTTTTDGSEPPTPVPGSVGSLYVSPVPVAGHGATIRIKAVTAKDQMLTSNVAQGTWTIAYPATATPTFSPAPGTYNANIGVTITTATADAGIWYTTTTDGSEPPTPVPGSVGSLYGTPITVAGHGSTVRIKAVATKDQMLTSSVAQGTWTIDSLTAPTGVSASWTIPDRVVISWNAVPNATGYLLWRSTDGATFSPIGGTINDVEYPDSLVTVGTTYSYRVAATDGFVTGPQSTSVEGRAGTRWYMESDSGPPWFEASTQDAMNTAFGSGNWTFATYTSVNTGELFSTAGLIVIEGGDATTDEMEAFLMDFQTELAAWVYGGGRLFVNSAPNVGDGWNLTFGGSTYSLVYEGGPTWSNVGVVVIPSHPIVVGPQAVSISNFTGGEFAHAYLTGPGITTIIRGDYDDGVTTVVRGPVLVEFTYGSGVVLLGGMTTTNFHSPQPDATNLRANILSYLSTR